MKECKHCNYQFDTTDKPKGWFANHIRWCKENPKFSEYKDTAKFLHTMKKTSNNQYSKAKLENRGVEITEETREKWRNSSRGRLHSIETKKKISESSLKSGHRRLRRNPILYKGILMDSTWEIELAKRLDSLNIKWNRPEPLKWVDNIGLEHNYFPDFYLEDFNLYLDPKNPHAYNVQKEKVEILEKLYDNLIFLRSLEECKNFYIDGSTPSGITEG